MKLILLASLLSTVVHCFGFASPAAGALSVTGSTGLVWDGGPSPTMTLQIKNNSQVEEVLLSYQVELQLTPVPGLGSGTLNFNSATLPVSNYVFDGRSLGNPPFSGPSAFIEDFFDLDTFLFLGDPFLFPPGVQIASGVSFDLVTLDFDDSDADTPSGLFFIELIPFVAPDETSYYTSELSTGLPTPFASAESGAAPFVVGSITVGSVVSVPEPSTGVLLSFALCLITSRWRTGRLRRENQPTMPQRTTLQGKCPVSLH